MHDELRQLFDEHQQPTYCSAQDVDNMITPILTLVSTAQQQVTVYRQRLMAAKRADRDPELSGIMERVKLKLAVLEKGLPELMTLGESLADSYSELSRLLNTNEQEVVAYVARMTAVVEVKV